MVINNASTAAKAAPAAAPAVTYASTVNTQPAAQEAPVDGGIVLPKTGPEDFFTGGLGIAGALVAGSLYAGSRRDLLKAMLNRE